MVDFEIGDLVEVNCHSIIDPIFPFDKRVGVIVESRIKYDESLVIWAIDHIPHYVTMYTVLVDTQQSVEVSSGYLTIVQKGVISLSE